MPALEIKKEFVLVVEGSDDKRFFENYFVRLGINCQIIEAIGKNNIRGTLRLLSKVPGRRKIRKLVVVRDADDDYEAAYKSIRDAFCDENFITNRKVKESIIKEGDIKFGIFVLPDNKRNGSIENLCLETIDERILDCIQDYKDCSKPDHNKNSKFDFLCYLAYRNPAAYSLGIAAEKGYIDFEHKVFDALKDFFDNFK